MKFELHSFFYLYLFNSKRDHKAKYFYQYPQKIESFLYIVKLK